MLGSSRAGAAPLTPADPRRHSRINNTDIHAPCSRCPAPDRAVYVVTDMANQTATTVLSYCTALVDLPCTRNWQTWVASLSSTSPLLAQEVLELLYELLRIEVFITQGARLLVRRRVIVLL